MARTDTLTNYLTDIANAIKAKKGDSTPILASDFDTEIENLPSGGGDLSEYFNDTITKTSRTNEQFGWTYLVKKIPDVKIISSLTDLSYCFEAFKHDIDFTEYKDLDVSKVARFNYMFQYCENSSINISNFKFKSSGVRLTGMFFNCSNLTNVIFPQTIINVENIEGLFSGCTSLQEVDLSMLKISGSKIGVRTVFYNCTSLQKIDMRNLVFSTATDIYNPFYNVPTNCLIIVKDATEKAWFGTKFPELTNVVTAEEYENQ